MADKYWLVRPKDGPWILTTRAEFVENVGGGDYWEVVALDELLDAKQRNDKVVASLNEILSVIRRYQILFKSMGVQGF